MEMSGEEWRGMNLKERQIVFAQLAGFIGEGLTKRERCRCVCVCRSSPISRTGVFLSFPLSYLSNGKNQTTGCLNNLQGLFNKT